MNVTSGNLILDVYETTNNDGITDMGTGVTLSGLSDILQTTFHSFTNTSQENGSVLELSYSVIIPLAVIGGFLAILLCGFLLRSHCTNRANNGINKSSFFRSNLTPDGWRSSTHSNQSTALLHRANDGRQSSTSTKSQWEFTSKLNKISESPEIKQQNVNDYRFNKKVTTPVYTPKECTCGAAHSEPSKKHLKVYVDHVNNSYIDSQATLQSGNTISEFNKYAMPKITEEMQVSSEPNLLNTGLHDNRDAMRQRAGLHYLGTYAKRPSYISGLPQFNPLLKKAISDCKVGSRGSLSSQKDLTDSNLDNSNSNKHQSSLSDVQAPSGSKSTASQRYNDTGADRRIKRRSYVQSNTRIKRPNYGPQTMPKPAFDGSSFASSISYDDSKLTLNSASEVSLASNVGHWQYNQLYKDPSIPSQCRINDLSSIHVLSESGNHESSHLSMYPSMGSFDNGTANGTANNATNTDVSIVTNNGGSNTSRLGSNENRLNINQHDGRHRTRDEQREVTGNEMMSYMRHEVTSSESQDFRLADSIHPFMRSKGQGNLKNPNEGSLMVNQNPYVPRSCISNPYNGEPSALISGDGMLINPRNLTLSTSLIDSDSETVHNNTPTGLLNPSFSENISMISTSDAGFGKVDFLSKTGNRTPINYKPKIASWALHHSLPEKTAKIQHSGLDTNHNNGNGSSNYFMPPRKIFYKHWDNAINFDSPPSVSSDSNTISIKVSPLKRSKPLKRSSFDPSLFHQQQDILRRSARSRRSHPQRIPLKSTEYWV